MSCWAFGISGWHISSLSEKCHLMKIIITRIVVNCIIYKSALIEFRPEGGRLAEQPPPFNFSSGIKEFQGKK